MAHRLLLLGTSACALCDEARALVAPIAGAFGWTLVERDVVEDDALFARYGERVPVLLREDSREELAWPFSAPDVLALASKPRDG